MPNKKVYVHHLGQSERNVTMGMACRYLDTTGGETHVRKRARALLLTETSLVAGAPTGKLDSQKA